MSDWYDAAKKHFNTVTGKAHAAFADAAREFYDNGGDSSATPTGADVDLTGYTTGTAGAVAATDSVNAAIAKLEARIVVLENPA